jgi:hypothetical protein
LPSLPALRVIRSEVFCLLLLAATPLVAQVSLVSVDHPAYDWIRYQETLGNVEGYSAMDLPLSRADLVGFLDQLLEVEEVLSATELRRLGSFRSEFSLEGVERSAKNNCLRGETPFIRRVWEIHQPQAEPRLFADVGEGYAYAVDMWATPFGRWDYWEGPDGQKEGTRYSLRGLGAFGALGDHVGFDRKAEQFSAGERDLLLRDPKYGRTSGVIRQDRRNSLVHESSLSVDLGRVLADIGHGALRFGPGTGPSLLPGRESPTNDWIRARYRGTRFSYTALMASLNSDSSEGEDLLVVGEDSVSTRYAPDRWMALQPDPKPRPRTP